MPGRRVFDLIEIPEELWRRADVLEALRDRDIGRLFVLLHRYTKVSQTRLAIACDTTQPKISRYMRGTAKVEAECLRADRGRALRAAEDVAPEEIAGRPAARRLVRDLMTTAPLQHDQQVGPGHQRHLRPRHPRRDHRPQRPDRRPALRQLSPRRPRSLPPQRPGSTCRRSTHPARPQGHRTS